jgi:CubicO group peptidase (beta-lactamase class C family)
MMERAVVTGVFPGAVLLAGDRTAMRYEAAFGLADRFAQEPTRLDTVYDLASLTKPLATTLAVMALVAEGKIRLDTTAGELLPAFRGTEKEAIQIRHLMCHRSGLPALRPYHLELVSLAPENRRAALHRMLAAEPLEHPIGTETLYSDLGFMILCWMIEEITHLRLDRFVHDRFYAPLGLDRLFFPDPAHPPKDISFAAAEQCPWRKRLLRGSVSDENAWVTGGINGHAGLFGTAGNVYRLLQALLQSRTEEENPLRLPPALVATFLSPDSPGGRALGFDTPSRTGSSSGTRFSRHSVGHLGFTGTSFWMDLERGLIVILLSNRVHPSRENNAIRLFRPAIHDAVMDMLLKSHQPFKDQATDPENKI